MTGGCSLAPRRCELGTAFKDVQTGPEGELERACFELARRAFTRHAWGPAATRDPRWLADVLAVARYRSERFALGPEHIQALESMRGRLAEVDRAQRISAGAPERVARAAVSRIGLFRARVLAPQRPETRRPDVLAVLAQRADDVGHLLHASGSGDVRLARHARRVADELERRREQVVALRSELDRETLGALLVGELRAAVADVPNVERRFRPLALDRCFEAQRQLVTCVPAPEALETSHLAIAITRRYGTESGEGE